MPKLSFVWSCQSKVYSGPHCPSGSSLNLDVKIIDGRTHIPTATFFMILFLIPRKDRYYIFAVMKSFAEPVKMSLHKAAKVILRYRFGWIIKCYMSLSNPPHPTAQTTYSRDMKFGMESQWENTFWAIRGFFQFPPLSRDMRVGWGSP